MYFLPSLQENQALALAENVADDIQAEFDLAEEPKIEPKSSLMRLVQRKSHSKIVSSITRFQTRSSVTEFEQKFDGMFVPIEQLMLCLNPCAQYCTDLFDQIELMRLNQLMIKNCTHLGQVPRYYFPVLDYALQQLGEAKEQLKMYGADKYVDFLEGIDVEKCLCAYKQKHGITDGDVDLSKIESVNLQYYFCANLFYKEMRSLSQEFVEYHVQQLRYTNFANLNQI